MLARREKGRDTPFVAQEPKSQTQDASPEKSGGKAASPQGGGKRPPRGGKNKRGPNKGGRRQGGGRDRDSAKGPLTTGLFSGLQDKRLPCKIKGCKETFLWTAQDQLRNFGKPPPSRMCEMHAAQYYDLKDMELPCRNAECKETWIWKRGAQLHALQRQNGEGELKPPSRLCETCFNKERNLKDQEVECRTQGCERTWVWTRDAQIRHRAWLRRELAKAQKEEKDFKERKQAEKEAKSAEVATVEIPKEGSETPVVADAAPAEAVAAAPEEAKAQDAAVEAKGEETTAKESGKQRKRRKKPRRLQEGPPERHCKCCADRFAKLTPVDLPCKVHGCNETWVWDRVSQLKAWVALGTDDVEAPVKIAKRMCTRCRDFCKKTKERDVPCAKEGCNETWRFKVGAQLQHVLGTGGIEDPRRLCETCIQEQYKKNQNAEGEMMPCAKPGCDGTWFYYKGMELAPDDGSEIPPDRLCNACRAELGLEARPMPEPASSEPAGEQSSSDQAAEASAEPSSQENAAEASTEQNDSAKREGESGPSDEPAPGDLPN